MYNPTAERFAAGSITAKGLIAFGYDVRQFQISGGPNWVGTDGYDVVAKPEADIGGDRIRAMVRGLLTERLHLKLHRESRELPVLVLVAARGESKLQPSAGHGPDMRGGRGRLMARKVTMGMLAGFLGDRVGRPVLDRTGIGGEFDINLEWVPDESTDPGPSIFTALQEQLGLRLEAQRGPVDVLIVDHVERPSPD